MAKKVVHETCVSVTEEGKWYIGVVFGSQAFVELCQAESVWMDELSWRSVHHYSYTTLCTLCCIYRWPYKQMDLPHQNLLLPLEEVIMQTEFSHFSYRSKNAFNYAIQEHVACHYDWVASESPIHQPLQQHIMMYLRRLLHHSIALIMDRTIPLPSQHHKCWTTLN